MSTRICKLTVVWQYLEKLKNSVSSSFNPYIAIDQNSKMGWLKRKPVHNEMLQSLANYTRVAICWDWLYRQAECYIDVVISRGAVWTPSASTAFLTRSLHTHALLILLNLPSKLVPSLIHTTLSTTLLPLIIQSHYTRNSHQLRTINNKSFNSLNKPV